MSGETTTPTPVKWYTFYSEKNGREYYYEPNSKVVTWIRPHELNQQHHTHPVVPTTPPSVQQDESSSTTPVTRRVSFHSSVDSDKSRSEILYRNQRTDSTRQQRRINIVRFTLLLSSLLIIVAATYAGWIPRGPLASIFMDDVQGTNDGHSHHELGKAEVHENAVSSSSSSADQIVAEPASVNKSNTSIETATATKPPQRILHHDKQTEAMRKEQEGDTSRYKEGEGPGMEQPKSGKRPFERDAPAKRTAACFIPFAHFVSKHCRKMLAQRPAYDMDALLDSLI